MTVSVSPSQVILALKTLSVSFTEAASFDREKWRVQLEPIIELWAKLTAAGVCLCCGGVKLSQKCM